MKEIVITEEDLKEILDSEPNIYEEPLTTEQERAFEIIQTKNIMTHRMLAKYMDTKVRKTRHLLEALREKGLIDKQYKYIKSYDGIERKTAIFYEIDKNGNRKNNKKV